MFDVHGPVKSVTFTVSSNQNLWQLDYIVSKVEYLPRGNKWNIKGNQNYELNYFQRDENHNFICDFIDEEDLNVSIIYPFNPKTHRYDERTIQVAPEYDGCDLLYIYNCEYEEVIVNNRLNAKALVQQIVQSQRCLQEYWDKLWEDIHTGRDRLEQYNQLVQQINDLRYTFSGDFTSLCNHEFKTPFRP